ncbi:UNVERIFIED_CONTAM: hypothetical protein FKN15_057977 [Acipenser sinensis]
MSGQTLTDRIAAAQYSVTGSAVARAVCKATTHEVMGPKKKHLDYLIQATNETNVNIPQMADTLFERATNSSWVVVFKALVTTHHMMVQGNETSFTVVVEYIYNLLSAMTFCSSLSNYWNRYDMSTFIRRYSRYMNEKAFAYRQMAFDFARVKKGADGVMRTMTPDKLLKGMPILQGQIDALLEFDAPSSLLDTLEQHLNTLEGKKQGNKFNASTYFPFTSEDAFSSPPRGASPKLEGNLSADLLSGLGGAFMAPSPAAASPAPAQNNLMQPTFDAAFGTTPIATSTGGNGSFDSSVFDGLGDLLMPTMTPQGQGAGAGLGGMAGAQSSKVLAGDLDSSLANLVGNLGIAAQKKDLQWNAGEKKLTGGVNWQPKVAPATWGTPGSQIPGSIPTGTVPPVGGVPPVGAVPPGGAVPPMGTVPPQPGFAMPSAAGAGAPMMPQSSMMYPQPMMRPSFGASASPGAPVG